MIKENANCALLGKRVVVTGSSGFIGNSLVQRLIDCRAEVFGVDLAQSVSINSHLRFTACNLLDSNGLKQLFTTIQPELVVHLAARTDLNGTSLKDYAPNTEGVRNLIGAVRNTRSVRRCIFTSSQLVCKAGYSPKDSEDYFPTTPYGESKVQTEKIVRALDGGGIEWCLVRPTTVWGPGMSRHYQRFLQMVKKGRYYHVGNKSLFKHYGYVENVVYQYRKLLEATPAEIHTNTFYLADYEAISLRDWINAIQMEFNAPRVKTIPEGAATFIAKIGDLINGFGFRQFPFNSFRLNNVLTEYQFDLSNTRGVCGPLPFKLADGVSETTRWYNNLDE